MRSRRWIMAFSLFLVLAVTARADEGTASLDEMTKRLSQGSVFDLVSLIYPDDRPEFAFAMSMQAASTLMIAPQGEATERAKEEYGAILVRFRVNWPSDDEPPPQSAAEVTARTRKMFRGVDIVRLAEALKAFAADHSGGLQALGDEGLGKLENVKIRGDQATGTIRGKSFTLKKTSAGRWFLRMPTA